MKQTAVEWVHEKLATSQLEDMQKNINLWFKQAKEMEKQQIEDAFMVGVKNEKYRFDTKTQYYNETFNK